MPSTSLLALTSPPQVARLLGSWLGGCPATPSRRQPQRLPVSPTSSVAAPPTSLLALTSPPQAAHLLGGRLGGYPATPSRRQPQGLPCSTSHQPARRQLPRPAPPVSSTLLGDSSPGGRSTLSDDAYSSHLRP
jgi:hypothetical protein